MAKNNRFSSLIKKAILFIRQNLFITIFLGIIGMVGVIVVFKILFAKEYVLYTRVKVSQGLWWANTTRPSVWLARSIHPGDMELSLSGKPSIKVLDVRTYPYWGSEQYDVYLTLKLDVSYNRRTGKYTFKRSQIAVGSPIDMEFPKVAVSGTVIEMSEKPLSEKLVEKNIVLKKTVSESWEGESVVVGDKYFDGKEIVFEILSKEIVPIEQFLLGTGTNAVTIASEKPATIYLQAKIKGKMTGNIFVFREEQPIQLGRSINIASDNQTLNSYTVIEIK